MVYRDELFKCFQEMFSQRMRVWDWMRTECAEQMGPVWGTLKVGVGRWGWCSRSTEERWKEEAGRVLPVG